MKKSQKITKNMTISEVLEMDENLAEVFMGFGMFCVFCGLGKAETVEEACAAHEVDLDLLLKKLNEEIK